MRARAPLLALLALLAAACGARITIRSPIRVRVGRPTAAEAPTPAVVVVFPLTLAPEPTVEAPTATPPPPSPTHLPSATATAAPSDAATPTIIETRAPATPVTAATTPSPTPSPGRNLPAASPTLSAMPLATRVATPPPRLPSAAGAHAVRFLQLRFSVHGEFVQIVNRGPDQDLSGWRLASTGADQAFAFPDGYTLRQGETVTVHSGSEDAPSEPGHLLWTADRMWLNALEEALLRDADGRLVDRWPRR